MDFPAIMGVEILQMTWLKLDFRTDTMRFWINNYSYNTRRKRGSVSIFQFPLKVRFVNFLADQPIGLTDKPIIYRYYWECWNKLISHLVDQPSCIVHFDSDFKDDSGAYNKGWLDDARSHGKDLRKENLDRVMNNARWLINQMTNKFVSTFPVISVNNGFIC